MNPIPRPASQPLRFVANGLAATLVHYAVLHLCIEVLAFDSAGMANLTAACFGITASFLGNRWFVFAATGESAWHQLGRFSLLYAALALMQGAVLWWWTDHAGFDYRAGFVIGTALQVVCSYYGGKHWVFRR